jgi:WD40 repeat protein
MNSYQYQIGGSLSIDASCYIGRSADEELFQALLRGEFCYVFNCRQMGKSSLRVQAKKRLEDAGMHCVSLDMTNIGSRDISPGQWYKSIAAELWRGFNLLGRVNFKSWWQENAELSSVQQLSYFVSDVILSTLKTEKIFIFIDEIDSVLSLNFSTDDFFALIRYFYNARAENPEFNRLTFGLFGVATPNDLISDQKRTPFNIGTAIALGGLKFPEVMSLAQGLSPLVDQSEALVREIIDWTGGQPFLTQKLCHLVRQQLAQEEETIIFSGGEAQWVKKLVQQKIIDRWESQDEPEHLKTISDRILQNEIISGKLLGMYRHIWLEGAIAIDNSKEQMSLLLSGLVIKDGASLVMRNPIYRAVFDLTWIDRQLDRLRPYYDPLNKWVKSNYLDQSRLLGGQALQDAQVWARDKILSELDYRYLAASQELSQQVDRQQLEAARLQEIEARLEAQKLNDRRQKMLIAALSVALIFASSLGLVARRQYKKVIVSEQQIAKSQRQTLVSVIDAIATSSEALYASEQRLAALTKALAAKAALDQLEGVESKLKSKVERNLRRAVYGTQEVNRLSGHTGPIWSINFSPDQELILSTSEDHTAKLWYRDGTLLRTFKGHKAGVGEADFNQDQSKIVTASLDQTLKIWDIKGKLLKTLTGHQDRVWHVQYAPQDQLIASASWDKTIKLWTPQGKLITTLTGHRDRVAGISFSQDGKILASASWDKTIKLWDIPASIQQKKPVIIATLAGHTDAVNDVSFAGDQQTLVSASQDTTLIIWDLRQLTQPKIIKTLKSHEDRVTSVAYNPKTEEIVSTSDDKTVKLWSLGGDLITTLKGHKDRVTSLGIGGAGKILASGGFDRTIILWQPKNNLLRTLEGHTDGVWAVDFSPDSQLIASGGRDSTVRLWTTQGKLLRTLRGHQDHVNDVAFHPNSKWLASVADDRTVKIWNLQGKVLQSFQAHNSSAFVVTFSPDGKYLATASDSSEIKIWNLQGELIKTFSGHQGAIIELKFSQDGQTLASSSRDSTVKLWSWQEETTTIKTLRGHRDVVYGVASSPDSKMWATSSWDRTIKLWSAQGNQLKTIAGHDSEVNQVSFSPSGQMIASAGADQTVRLWNLNGKELLGLELHTSNVWSVDFSDDSKFIVSAGDDHRVIVWNLQRLAKINYFEYGCNWIHDYLKTNPHLTKSDRQVCESRVRN